MSEYRRLEWIKEKTSQGLGYEPELFDQLIENEQSKDTIVQFLDGGKCTYNQLTLTRET